MTNHPNRSRVYNIRNASDRTRLLAKGFVWVTVVPRGENKGVVRSKHRTYDAADRAAKGRDRTIVEVISGDSF